MRTIRVLTRKHLPLQSVWVQNRSTLKKINAFVSFAECSSNRAQIERKSQIMIHAQVMHLTLDYNGKKMYKRYDWMILHAISVFVCTEKHSLRPITDAL
jgi:hypothetical protein